ncbi:protein scarlet isoform X2 [Bemisia tabaci]|uniref:protein scarlet isoform X2 n=1 Tax=Bemisia tabaci TaxID=7038 RepID=UPI0008F9A651|nr:PREDICTED: protein scarlet-like isoform X2 [Bemisia tabaci]
MDTIPDLMHDFLVLSWKNVTCYAEKPSKNLHSSPIISDVSGIAKSGTLTAVMSPSGAGKTSLLAALNKRSKCHVEGQILLNGCNVDQELMSKISGFVPQKDLSIESLTVQEHLEFMARLKMDRHTSWKELLLIVTNVIEHLSLSHRADTQLSALSGGQRKRLGLANQLLMNPQILFCDEPTTGLDSFSAMNVIKLLRRLANEGKMIICAIHQPTSGVFEKFDSVSLLVSGGKLAYHGEVSTVLDHFKNIGLICPPTFNQAEFLVSTVATLPTEDVNSEQKRVNRIADSFKRSAACAALLNELDAIGFGSKDKCNLQFSDLCKIQPAKLSTQFVWLLWRSYINLRRTSQANFARFCLYALVMLMVSVPYADLQINQTGIQNLQGLLYSAMAEIIFSSAYSVLFTFPEEIPVFLYDVGDNVYSTSAYYTSKVVMMLPRTIIETFLLSSIVFWITGLRGGISGWFEFAIRMIFGAITATSYGACLSATFESINTASLVSVPVDFIGSTFGGLFIQLRSLPFYMAWIKYISMFFYTFELLSIQQWRGVTDIPCSKSVDNVCYTTGEQVLHSYGLQSENNTLDFFGLIVMFCIFHVIGFFSLLRRSQQVAAY